MNRRGFVARVLGVLAVGPLAKYLPAAEPSPITFTVGEDEVFSLKGSQTITSSDMPRNTAYFLGPNGPYAFTWDGHVSLNEAHAQRRGVFTDITEG